ncbi:hypothetical protein HJG60_007817 [Phyllostomus discolor]|uniref:Uncharacterized protein n=1 Tax=Phyllostomus discolor TaxID=89673 RepID=A0A834BKY9_9CHIR|nr:hypothetical protein HJG60_007817 [Phyllostomus discolor]
MPSGSQRTCLCSRNLWAGERASALPGSDALVSWEGIAVPQEPSGAQSPSAVAGHAPGPPLPRSGTEQHPGDYPRHPELLFGPVNSWEHALGAFLLAGLLVYSNYLTDRTLNWEPATHLAPGLVVEVDVFPKMHPSHCAPNAWTSKASTRKPFQKLERIVCCWCVGLAKCIGGRCSRKVQELESPGVEEVTCHQPPRGWPS